MSAPSSQPTEPGRRSRAASAAGGPGGGPWLAGALLAAALSLAYLLASPPSGDLAAATYRAALLARHGFAIWDTGWYGGHNLPAYSLLAPALGDLIGLRPLLALTAPAAAMLFGALAGRAFARRSAALAATLSFAFGFSAELPSGRVPFDLAVPIGLAALLALVRSLPQPGGGAVDPTGRPPGTRRPPAAAALLLAALTSAASPVAGAFLALAGVALAGASLGARPLTGPRRARALAGARVSLAALLPIAALVLAFPEGGSEPFAAGAFWPELAGAGAIAALLPRGSLGAGAWPAIRIGAAIYALALTLSFAVPSPVGGNAVRLGALFGAPVVIGALWQAGAVNVLGRRPSWAVLALALAPALLYWQLATAIDDQIALHGDRTVSGAYYAPLRAELARLAAGRPIRVEVPMTGGHWESAYLPSARPGPQISLARGWERQLDTRYAALFYGSGLGAGAYRAWLQRNAVSYVALPDARLDDAGRAEAALVRAGLPYLRELWRSAHWRLFEVLSAAPLAQAPARLEALEAQGFTLAVPRAGHFRVALRFTPYWAVLSGSACVGEAAGGYTYLSTTRPGRVRVGVRFSLARIFDHGARCT